MSQQKFPPGWDKARIREVLSHYENQTEDEQFAVIEAAREAEGVTFMAVPTKLVPEVRALIAKKQSDSGANLRGKGVGAVDLHQLISTESGS